MSQRSFAVLVVPERWAGSSDELADRLVSVTHQPSDRLARALGRGPVTLDADLHREEAERLFEQLERLEIPAEIRDEEDDSVVSSCGGSEETTESASSEVGPDGDDGDDPDEAWGEFGELEESLESVVESAELAGEERDGKASSGGWEDVLGREGPDEESETTSAEESEPERASDRLSTPEQSDELPSEVPGVELDSPESSTTDTPPGPAEVAADGGRGLQMIEEADEQETPALEELSDDSTENADNTGVELSEPTVESGEPAAESGFDGARMTEALVDSGESPGLGDASFDDRPEHMPFVAALLSLVAPGAGQVYNGETDKAWRYAFRAILVLPWIRAVIDALEQGEAIRDGELRRPPEGTFVEALKHGAMIYAAAIAFGLGGSLVVKVAYQQIYPDEPTSVEMPNVDRQNAFREATLTVHGARIDAWQRAGEKRVSDEDRFTMSPEARAARLFGIGYQHCRALDYQMCESAMRKVTQIDSPYRKRAFRLQSWASVQQNPNVAARPMPDVKVSKGLLEGTPDAGVSSD